MAPPLDVFSESFTNYFESLKINTQYCTYLIILITLCVCVCIYCLNCTVPFWFVSLSIPVAILNRFVSSIISIFIHLRCFPFCLVNKQTKKKTVRRGHKTDRADTRTRRLPSACSSPVAAQRGGPAEICSSQNEEIKMMLSAKRD